RRFVLAYHYLVQEHIEQARAQYENVLKLQPKDELSAQFAKALGSASQAPKTATTGAAPESKPAAINEPARPPASLVGSWKAEPMRGLFVALTLLEDGQFTWDVSAKGHTDSITGDADYRDEVLTLTQAQAPAMAGKVLDLSEKQFRFELVGGPQQAKIQFSR